MLVLGVSGVDVAFRRAAFRAFCMPLIIELREHSETDSFCLFIPQLKIEITCSDSLVLEYSSFILINIYAVRWTRIRYANDVNWNLPAVLRESNQFGEATATRTGKHTCRRII